MCATFAASVAFASPRQAPGDSVLYARGHRDLSRYTTPGLCIGALKQEYALYQGTLEAQDSMVWRKHGNALAGVTIPGAPAVAPYRMEDVSERVRVLARTCGASFSVATAKSDDLGDLFRLALWARNDTLARRIFVRRLAVTAPDTARMRAGREMIEWMIDGPPARLDVARDLIPLFDTLAHSAAARRVRAGVHDRLLLSGVERNDVAFIREESDRIIAAVQRDSAWGDSTAAVMHAYGVSLMLAQDQSAGAVREIARRAERALHTKRTPEALIETLLSSVGYAKSGTFGALAPRVHVKYWFPAPRDSMIPARGTPSLIIYMRPQYGRRGIPAIRDGQEVFQDIRRWAALYDSRLPVTVLFSTGGTFAGDSVRPAEEAEMYRRYLLDRWHLPVRVAVQESPVVTDSGGEAQGVPHVSPASNAFERAYFAPGRDDAGLRRKMTAILTDAEGRILYEGEWSAPLERAIYAAVSAVPAPPVTASTSDTARTP